MIEWGFVSVCLIIMSHCLSHTFFIDYHAIWKESILYKGNRMQTIVCKVFSIPSLCKIAAFFWVFCAVTGVKRVPRTTSNITDFIPFILSVYLSLGLVTRFCQVVVTKLLWNTSLQPISLKVAKPIRLVVKRHFKRCRRDKQCFPNH